MQTTKVSGFVRTDGVTAVEFALIAPFLLLLCLGLLEVTLIITAQFVLETAVRDTARTAARQAPTTLAAVRPVFDKRLPSFMPAADVTLIATSRSPITGNVASGTGGPGDFVTYQAGYVWQPFIPLMTPIFEALPLGELRLSATTTARNE